MIFSKAKKTILLLMVMLMTTAVPVAAMAAVKTVKKSEFTTKLSAAEKKGLTVKKGKTVLKVSQGYVKFTAPASGKYTFTFAGLKQLSSKGYEVGHTSFMKKSPYSDTSITTLMIKTKGGKTSAMDLCTKAFHNKNNKGKKITTSTYIPSRSTTLSLKKGEKVFIYMYFGSQVRDQITLTIKRK